MGGKQKKKIKGKKNSSNKKDEIKQAKNLKKY